MKVLRTYLIDPIKNHYIDFSGKATRKQFWLFILFSVVALFILNILFIFLGKVGGLLGWIVTLALLLPILGISIRRVRDAGMPSVWGWGILGLLLPTFNLKILGILFLFAALITLILCLFPSKK